MASLVYVIRANVVITVAITLRAAQSRKTIELET
jgi:hypothetical protein